MDSQLRFVLAIAIRVFMGALLWWLAEDLRHTPVMRVVAAIAIFAAVGILIMGRERLDKLVCLVALAFRRPAACLGHCSPLCSEPTWSTSRFSCGNLAVLAT